MNTNPLKLVIADDNDELRNKLAKELSSCEFLQIVGLAKTGEECFALVQNFEPDLVILDPILSELDGFSVIEKSKEKKTKFIIQTSFSSELTVNKAVALGVQYYLLKPCDTNAIIERIQDMFFVHLQESGNDLIEQKKNDARKVVMQDKNFDEKITNIFITVGIPAHIKGYYFLREAIKLAISNPNIINSITKQLYPSIAGRFETSASKVERAIRHAIEVAWNKGKIENINSVFGLKIYSSNEKPTNGEFIALVADKMLLEG